MIAHSLPDPYFGPASQMHGATYVVDAEFFAPELNEHNVVLDIGYAHQVLKEVLSLINYQNLDKLGVFQDQLTTTEHLAFYIHRQLTSKVRGHFQGRLKITLGESHIAWATFEAAI